MCLCDVFRALINSLVCLFRTSALGLVLFQIVSNILSFTNGGLFLNAVHFRTRCSVKVTLLGRIIPVAFVLLQWPIWTRLGASCCL